MRGMVRDRKPPSSSSDSSPQARRGDRTPNDCTRLPREECVGYKVLKLKEVGKSTQQSDLR